MSRIRSQLDSTLDAAAERGASARPASAPGVQRRLDQRGGQRHAAASGPGSAGADVERVRSQLDRLAGKLDADHSQFLTFEDFRAEVTRIEKEIDEAAAKEITLWAEDGIQRGKKHIAPPRV